MMEREREQPGIRTGDKVEVPRALQIKNCRALIRRVCGKWSEEDWRNFEDPDSELGKAIRALTEHLVRHPKDLEAQQQWLFGPEAEQAAMLGRSLGQRDTWDVFEPLAVRCFASGKNTQFTTGYLFGKNHAGADTFLYRVLDHSPVNSLKAELLYELISYLLIDERAIERLIEVIGSGFMTDATWEHVELGGWYSKLTQEQSKRVVAAMLAQAETYDMPAAIETILHLSSSKATYAESFQVWEPEFDRVTAIGLAGTSSMAKFYWAEIAQQEAEARPREIARVLVAMTKANAEKAPLRPYDREMLAVLLANHPIETLSAILEAKQKPDGHLVTMWLESNPLELLQANSPAVVVWMEEHGEEGKLLVERFRR